MRLDRIEVRQAGRWSYDLEEWLDGNPSLSTPRRVLGRRRAVRAAHRTLTQERMREARAEAPPVAVVSLDGSGTVGSHNTPTGETQT